MDTNESVYTADTTKTSVSKTDTNTAVRLKTQPEQVGAKETVVSDATDGEYTGGQIAERTELLEMLRVLEEELLVARAREDEALQSRTIIFQDVTSVKRPSALKRKNYRLLVHARAFRHSSSSESEQHKRLLQKQQQYHLGQMRHVIRETFPKDFSPPCARMAVRHGGRAGCETATLSGCLS